MDKQLPRATLVFNGAPVVLALCILALPACSNRQVYDAIQQNRQLECQKLPGTQYDECMQQFSEPYDEYRRQRDELIKEEG
ncbi:MAG: hypothetical protein V2I26_09130 [Halieaceae bacterium]|jgi:hypothetical protein|nr:hypothetical protein [Halieaceae bacterium]